MRIHQRIVYLVAALILLLSLPGTLASAAPASAVFPKTAFLGEYHMNHDGWSGTLTLTAIPDDFHADYLNYPNISGAYVGADGFTHHVRGYVRTATYPIPLADGPDHHILFYIDFNDTPSTADDQEFDGYLYTQITEAIAGTTTWSGTAFGFYAIKAGGPVPTEGLHKAATLPAKAPFLGIFTMNHDGWKGSLKLWAVPDDPAVTLPNIVGTYTGADGVPHDVRGFVRTPTYDLPLAFGPDHRVVFHVDFADTADPLDDQMFEGYLFTQTKEAFAGVTYWSGVPFGFYAIAPTPIYLPLISR